MEANIYGTDGELLQALLAACFLQTGSVSRSVLEENIRALVNLVSHLNEGCRLLI